MEKAKSHTELSDHEFENQFSLSILDPELFTHEAHLRLAWIHLRKYGLTEAKYNHTVTIAAIKIVNHFMNQSDAITFTQFTKDYPRLSTHFKELILSYYHTNVFESEEAKIRFIEPELMPFDTHKY